jgi:putative transposase
MDVAGGGLRRGVPHQLRHRRQQAQGRGRPRASRASGRPRTPHPARIDDEERQRIVGVLCEPRFVDLAPAQVYATLLDEGVYLCSIRQLYRLLAERGLVGERRRGHDRRKTHVKPRVKAKTPNQAWSWRSRGWPDRDNGSGSTPTRCSTSSPARSLATRSRRPSPTSSPNG